MSTVSRCPRFSMCGRPASTPHPHDFGPRHALGLQRELVARQPADVQQVVGETREMPHLPLQNRLERSEEHTSELQSHSFISYAVFCLNKNELQTASCTSYAVFCLTHTRHHHAHG